MVFMIAITMAYHDEPQRTITILDVLNEDCWRIILDFLDIKDIIRSERVSHHWQDIILQYLLGVHFCIEYPWYSHETCNNIRILLMDKDDPEKFNRITRKWGPYVKKADCINKASLKVIAKHCPNLENIMTVQLARPLEIQASLGYFFLQFYGLHDFVLLNAAQHNFKKLKRVYFRGCQYATDKCISKWLSNDTIEELALSMADQVTGQCLTKTNNLRTLSFHECTALEFHHLSAADLTSLTKLELINVPKNIFENILSLFNKLPKLEDLCLRWKKKLVMGNELAEGISRLGLKRLDLSFNPNASDEWMEIIARGCSRLEELLVEGCLGVTPRGVQTVCEAGAPLRSLHVGSSVRILDHHVEGFITSCPRLTCVDVSYCGQLTPKLVGAAGAAARGRRLRLRLRAAATRLAATPQHHYKVLGQQKPQECETVTRIYRALKTSALSIVKL